ncbi:protein Spindly-like [Mytilus edulis]
MESKYEKKIDDLLQENYQLKSSLQEYKSKENWYKEEISQYEQASSHGHGRSDKNDKQFRVKEVELKEKVSSLRHELELTQQSEKEHQDRIAELEKIVADNQRHNVECNVTKVDCDETLGINTGEQVAQLHDEITELKAKFRTDKTELDSLKKETDKLRYALLEKDEELVNVKTECTTYCNLLEKARMENLELTTQLDVLMMEDEEKCHDKKGNSLFSELDDRRVEAEKTLMSQKNTFETMKKKNEVLKQHNQKLKMQLFTAMGRGNDDSERVQQLQAQLEQERIERQQILEKVNKLEENQAKEKLTDKLSEFSHQITNQTGVDKDYIEYLVNMLKSKEGEIEDLSRRLRIQSMCLLDQKNKVTEKERLLYAAETKKDEMLRKFQQLKLEKEGLEIELKPEMKKAQKPVGRTEQIPTGLEGIKEKNVSVLREKTTSENEYRGADREWALNLLKKVEEDKKKDQIRSRSVRMSDDVDVFDADGHMNTTSLKDDENYKRLVRDKPSHGKVTVCTKKASEPKYKVDDCNTQ